MIMLFSSAAPKSSAAIDELPLWERMNRRR